MITPRMFTSNSFFLVRFSDIQELQILHFVLFLVIYLVALTGNLFIIATFTISQHLHTPMYFFLMNLSIMDLGFISVTIPKAIVNSLRSTRLITYYGCAAQVFFLLFFMASDFFLLTIMAYDRYVAICDPLHYEMVMNRGACIQMAASAWISGFFYAALHTGSTFAITFCSRNVNQFFCEIPQLLKLSCSNTYLIEVAALAFSACLGSGCFGFIVVSYVQIFRAVLRIPSKQGRQKSFSTCLPHLFVVSLFLCKGIFANLKPPSSSISSLDHVVAVFYCVVPPVLNPVIYSMRNKEIKAVLLKLTVWRFSTKNKMSVFHL
uniref:Olfactory receptor n=1 Tax=Sphenodon punctatus TaxID=8508 RepID=A0A8D0GYJ6_SPHPU